MSEQQQETDVQTSALADSQAPAQTLLKEIAVQQAIGMRLAHDLTQIIPGQFKGRLFQKGHLITEQDIPKLLDIGKEHIYVMELSPHDLHEDDAALRMATALIDDSLDITEPHEGKVTIKSSVLGVTQIAKEVVDEINSLGEVALATVLHNKAIQPGGKLAATRVIPLVVSKQKVDIVVQIAENYKRQHNRAPITVTPLPVRRIGLLTTGSEVYNGRIKDKFGPAVTEKLASLGSVVAEQRYVPDDRERIVQEIHSLAQAGYDMILVTGGMSVDPDDRTPGAIAAAGAHIVSYGTPMLPGSMLLVAYLGQTPIVGLPGCVMHDPYTSFDALLPKLLLGERVNREDIVALGYGGLLG